MATSRQKSTPEPTGKAISKRETAPVVERQKKVSEAAYYLAEQRGFSAGDELGDWLQAEQQIDATFSQ